MNATCEQEALRDGLVERLFGATVGALELLSVCLGAELGLYRALAGHESIAPAVLARRAGIAERPAVEWLEQQAVAGLVHFEDAHAPSPGRRFRLPAEHASVLVP